MYKSTIIDAIQNQRMLRIWWQKETTGKDSECDIAPYDIFPKTKKGSFNERDLLLGLEYENTSYQNHPASIYLDAIKNIEVLNQYFDGSEVKRIINPKNHPLILRNW
jgi:hypothetical protein